MPAQEAMELEQDYTTRLIISDMGNDSYRYQLLRNNYPVDLKFTIGQEMTHLHPVLYETVMVKKSLFGFHNIL